MILPLTIFVFLAWIRPRIALGVIIASIPFYEITRFTIAGIPFTFPEVATYALAGVLGICFFLSSFRAERATASGVEKSRSRSLDSLRSLGMTSWLCALWLIIATIAAAYSPAGMRAWGAWKGFFVAPVLLYFVIRSMGDRVDLRRHVILPLAIGSSVVAVIAIVQRWWPIGVPYPWNVPGGFRATSVFGYPNAVGLFLGPLIPLFVGAAIVLLSSFRAERAVASVVEKSYTQSCVSNGVRSFASLRMTRCVTFPFLLFTSLLALIAIILAKSTGAFVALVVVTLMTAVVIIARRQKSPYPRILGREKLGTRVAIGIVLMWVFVSITITGALPYKRDLERIQNPIVRKLAFGAWSGSVRLEQYRETWPMLLDHPIRGAGLAGYKQAFAPYHNSTVEIFPYPHNLLLAVWSELGLAGIIIFLAILYQMLLAIFSSPLDRGWRYGIITAIIILLVHGLVDVPYFKNDLSMVFWVIAGLVFVPPRLDRGTKTA